MVEKTSKPPLSSKGGYAPTNPTQAGKPRLAINLDWLRYSVPYADDKSERENLSDALPPFPAFQLTGELVPNARGYNRAMKVSIGTIHWHTDNHAEGVSFELTGSALSESRAARIEDMWLIRHIASVQGGISTMDSALDVYNLDASKDDIQMLHDLGSLQTTVRYIGQHTGSKLKAGKWQGEGTAYIGSPKSPQQITIYNAFAKHGGDCEDWTRIEMTWRGRHARAAHIAMLRYGIEATTRKAILRMLDADIEWFQTALHGELADIEPVRRKDTDTVGWLADTIAPLLERELSQERSEGGTRLFDAYQDIIIQEQRARRKLRPSQR